MKIILLVHALKALWQRIWRSTIRIFHLFISFLFLAFAMLAGQKAFLAWQNYKDRPEEGLWLFYATGGVSVVLVIFALYSMLKARTVR